MVFVRRPFFHYDPACCGMPTLYGTVSERAAKTIRFNTLWQWKGYLGLNWDTINMKVLLAQDKKQRISTFSRKMILKESNTTSVTDVMCLLGKINFTSMAVPLGRLHSRPRGRDTHLKRIFRVIGLPVVDLFASAQTKQVRHYFSADRHDCNNRKDNSLWVTPFIPRGRPNVKHAIAGYLRLPRPTPAAFG